MAESQTKAPDASFKRTPLVTRLAHLRSLDLATVPIIRRMRRTAAILLFLASVVSAFVWFFFFTGPFEFERRTIHIATVTPIYGGSTLEITTVSGETYRLFESLYRRGASLIWRRDGIARVLREAGPTDVWVIPGRRRIQGFLADSAYASPSSGRRIESSRRFLAGILPLVLLLLGLVALLPDARAKRRRLATDGGLPLSKDLDPTRP